MRKRNQEEYKSLKEIIKMQQESRRAINKSNVLRNTVGTLHRRHK